MVKAPSEDDLPSVGFDEDDGNPVKVAENIDDDADHDGKRMAEFHPKIQGGGSHRAAE